MKTAAAGALLAVLLLAACGSESEDNAAPDGQAAAEAPGQLDWPEGPRPGFSRDVVLVTIDTLRADAPGFAGNARSPTPHLDRLAAGGWVFQRAWGHSVMTLPSHVNLLTGQLPYQHGVRDNAGFVLSEAVPTAAEAFAAAGFRTAAFVAAFPLDARYGLDRGFEVYDDSYPEGSSRGFVMAERDGDEVVRPASAWWKQHEGERRFLWVHLYEPHAPYEPAPQLAELFPDDPYLGEVADADVHLGELLDAVAPEGGASEALVVVTSDHGEALGEHGERTHGLFAYEATLAVPLVLWAEELSPARIGAPVRHVDVLPTMLEAAGVGTEAFPDLAGRSLWRGASPPEDAARQGGSPSHVYFESLHTALQRGWAPLRGVIAPWPPAEPGAAPRPEKADSRLLKYIELPIPERYDLDADPSEDRNLHAEDDIAAALASLLPAESEWPPAMTDVTEEERRALESLGYLSGSGGEARPAVYGEEDDPKALVELDRMMQEFSEAYLAGRLERAETLAREVVRRRPQMGAGHSNLAQTLLERGRVDEALAVMIQAQRGGVASLALQRQLALTLAEVGRAQEGARLMERHADSRDPDTLNVLGLVLAEAGQVAAAREALLRSLDIDERNPQARQTLALAACQAGDWRSCETESRLALDLNSALPLSWNYLGISLFRQGSTDGAIEAWRRAVELDPDDLDLLYNLGSVAASAGRAELARQALERFVGEAAAPERRGRYSSEVATARSLLDRL